MENMWKILENQWISKARLCSDTPSWAEHRGTPEFVDATFHGTRRNPAKTLGSEGERYINNLGCA
jgi:hypothetical protein